MLERLPATPPGLMRGLAMAAVVGQAGIAVTGAVVRVTGSGLGCPTWPQCFPGSLVPVPHAERHGGGEQHEPAAARAHVEGREQAGPGDDHERDGAEHDDLDEHDRGHPAQAPEHDHGAGDRGGREPPQHPVAPVEAQRDRLAGERRRHHGECEHRRQRRVDARLGQRDELQQREPDEQRERDDEREQHLLALAQRQLRLQGDLRREHPPQRPAPGGGREGAGLEPHHDRNSRPVSSRNTSSRLRRATRRSSASTPWRAHQEVTVESTCGSMAPSTR